ncbi:37S ribosomal protein S9, mitochondrial [Coemansia thaxteri]|uniref:37S ribosomal protein S9, mitochondrial n=1 Tax=Coemansia thaxteri TaxID=2663907 RepID=A0A9W8BJM7_9FUNG|nr:37S ribosomal protein S9, mitochondrial [Coemansia thaxteri]KAJ2485294.1 37S ribosomal protein S9, mitochondrial [Coemansia sp. RSA 2320]
MLLSLAAKSSSNGWLSGVRRTTPQAAQMASLSMAGQQQRTEASPFAGLDIRPVKRPDTAAYFMRKPKFYDLLSAISNLARQHPLPRFNQANYKRGKWIARRDLQTKLDIKISPKEHDLLVKRLNDVANLRIGDLEERETVNLYLNQFRRGYSHVEMVTVARDKDGGKTIQVVDKATMNQGKVKKNNGRRGFMDHLGRWHAFGRRKEATAFAWIVPVDRAMVESESADVEVAAAEVVAVADNDSTPASSPSPSLMEIDLELNPEIPQPDSDKAAPQIVDNVPLHAHGALGDIVVNGKPLAEYFFRGTDRESVLFPFQVANKVGLYNVFLKVSGGGHTGQAEACQLAVARALYMSDRKAHVPVREAGLLRTDGRAVERKKTGKPKARKSYTWVKR